MGAWGYGSFENDTACDFKSKLIDFENIENLARSGFSSKDPHSYQEVIATCAFLAHLQKLHGLWIDQEIIDRLKIKLDLISKDQRWINTWNDKNAIKNSLKSLKRRFSKVEGY